MPPYYQTMSILSTPVCSLHPNLSIWIIVPVSLGNGLRCHESMVGLDLMARWEPLTLANEARTHAWQSRPGPLPPLLRWTGVQQTQSMQWSRSLCAVPSRGQNVKMRYTKLLQESPSMQNHRKERRRKKSPTRKLREVMPIEPRVLGGPNMDFLERYGLNETSHPMDWFTAFMPMTLYMNQEDPAVTNVKEDRTTKFAVLNLMRYLHAKAMLCNEGVWGPHQ